MRIKKEEKKAWGAAKILHAAMRTDKEVMQYVHGFCLLGTHACLYVWPCLVCARTPDAT